VLTLSVYKYLGHGVTKRGDFWGKKAVLKSVTLFVKSVLKWGKSAKKWVKNGDIGEKVRYEGFW
jgi:hypothetical protein